MQHELVLRLPSRKRALVIVEHPASSPRWRRRRRRARRRQEWLELAETPPGEPGREPGDDDGGDRGRHPMPLPLQ